MSIFGTKSEVFYDYYSENSVWSSEVTETFRTFLGIKLWIISRRIRVLKYGEDYVAGI